jgi:hypothetical protein
MYLYFDLKNILNIILQYKNRTFFVKKNPYSKIYETTPIFYKNLLCFAYSKLILNLQLFSILLKNDDLFKFKWVIRIVLQLRPISLNQQSPKVLQPLNNIL